MLIRIPEVLTPEERAQCREILEQAEWIDGRVTAGHQSVKAKDNLQLPEDHPGARQMGELILAALQRVDVMAAAYLQGISNLSSLSGGHVFWRHVDNAIARSRPPHRVRTDFRPHGFSGQPSTMVGNFRRGTYGFPVKLPAVTWSFPHSLHHVVP